MHFKNAGKIIVANICYLSLYLSKQENCGECKVP